MTNKSGKLPEHVWVDCGADPETGLVRVLKTDVSGFQEYVRKDTVQEIVAAMEKLLKWHPISGNKTASYDRFGGASHTVEGVSIRNMQIESLEAAHAALTRWKTKPDTAGQD